MKNSNLLNRLLSYSHEKQSPQRFARYAAMLIMLLTLGVGQMWAWDISSSTFYVDNTSFGQSSLQLLVGSDGNKWSCSYNMTLISGTNNLYYKSSFSSGGWGTFYVATGNWGTENCENSKDEAKPSSRAGYCEPHTSNIGYDYSSKYVLIIPSSSSNNCSYTQTAYTGYSSLNYTQTLYQCVAENGGTPAKSTASIGTISITTKKLNGASTTTDNNGSISSGTNKIEKDAARTATVTMTVSDYDGYTFLGWYDSESGGSQLEDDETYTYVATSAKTVYARFSHETTHSVNITYVCSSTSATVSTATSRSIGQVTAASVTAPTVTGYTFSGWTLGDGVADQGSDLTANPISVKTLGSGTYTMQANYTEDLSSPYIVTGGNKIVTTGTTWRTTADANNKMNKKTGYSSTYDTYFTVNVTAVNQGSANSNYQFKIYNTSTSAFYGLTGSDQYFLNRAESGTAKALSSPGINVELRADALGEYELKVNYASDPTLTVTYPTAYAVNFGKGTGGGSVTAKYSSVSFDSGTKVQSGKTVRFTQTASTGYQFKEWNTKSNGSGEQLSTNSSYYDRTVASTNNVYAIYNPRQYAILLNDQDATTAVSPSSVNATYKSLTLSSAITNPEKDGYTFGGWYSAVGGGGYLIINTSGALQASKSGYTDAAGWTRTSGDNTVYAKWTQVLTLDKNGGTTDGSLTVIYKKTATSSHTPATRTGYTLAGYYDAESGGNKIINADGSLVSYSGAVSSYIRTDGSWGYNGTPTLHAQWTANQYDVTLKPNGATTGSDQVVRATYDATMPTQTKTSAALVAPTKTGYTLQGFYQNSNGTGMKYYNANMTSANNWDQAGNANIWAKWTPNPYTITLKQSTETGYGSAGTASVEATYDAALPTIASLPTAANGYAFMGYYTAKNGGGTQYYDASGTKLVASYTTADDLELFAYFKKAEITEITLSDAIVAPNTSITATPTISPTPTGTTGVCWELQYSNGTRVPSQPTFTPKEGNAVSFKAPAASATYILQAKLRLDDCDGEVLSTLTTTFQVAGEHTVTVRYQDASGMTLAASTEVTGKPLEWTAAAITAPTVTGYTFHHWLAGDGVTLSEDGTNAKTGVRPDSSGVSNIYIKANYDGTLTAVYNKKKMVYFNNTLNWDTVYVYFYNNASNNKYWADGWGTGANKQQLFNGNQPFYEMHYGGMKRVAPGSNIWYFDWVAEGWSESEISSNITFANVKQALDVASGDNSKDYFHNAKVVFRQDYNNRTSLPMFVPLTSVSNDFRTNTGSLYYSNGYWMNYPENTGYVLHVYDGTTYGQSDQLQQIPFEFTADKTLPMSINVELNAGKTYGFEIHRADGTVLGENSYTLVSGNSGDGEQTVRVLGTSERSKITTTVAGDYKFTLNFGNSGGYNYLIGVHYPVVAEDYRILYTDDATWSQGAHTGDYTWWHESRTIHKENGATDIVSFYVKKDNDTKMKFQYASSINASTGVVTWTDVPSGNIDLSDIDEDGVYNFYLTQANGGISVSKIEPYTGNYYIRTDCAGATRWENFRTTDHQMTYSDYAEENSGYSHYYAHWVEQYTNIKFVIANDYSPCISDTLAADYGTTIANITTSGVEAGKLKSASANIRFMWNQATNKISRAYIGGSSNIADRFLVLEGDTRMFNENGDTLTTAGGGKISGLNDYEMNLVDDQNFVYERTIKVNTGAKAKLTAKYNENIQYFKGGPGTTSADSVELLGGESSTTKHTMRIVYDFKTNRLMTAFVPSDTIKNAMAINADLMIVREHQEAGQQLLFNGGSLSEVHTVYGVMRFNRWTLNNKEKTGGHSVVGDPKSAYERGLYWISFPFDVKLSDVFGFGTYGTHWIIMEYDGAARATEGYWADSEGFWKYVMPAQRSTYTLESGKGYVLALDLDLMKDNNTSFWSNKIEQVELFFPSASYVSNIASTNVTTTVDSHECTIDRRTDKNSPDINKDRTRADSHWNIIGIPSYANYGSALKDGPTGSTIEWHTNPYTNDLPFLYEWSTVDNSYAVQSGTTYPFKAMHAYMVQYHGNLYWSLASATPPSIVARSTYAEKPESVEMRIELQQNEMKVDQTFVKLSNDENASVNFAFDEDLCKEFNANKANIYTIVENYLPVAGNTMPMSEQTTVVPVGVRIAADGEYTFSIPDGTEGIGVTLIDNETGIRTNLGLMDYTVTLAQGQNDDRFLLEISPISQISTDLEAVSGDRLEVSGARKIMIDGLLYIVKDGVVYDAQGRRL